MNYNSNSNSNSLLYLSKALRDAQAKLFKSGGYMVRRSTTGPCQIHPQYVEDLKHTPEGRDTGFGNTVYKTYFPNLYKIEYSKGA